MRGKQNGQPPGWAASTPNSASLSQSETRAAPGARRVLVLQGEFLGGGLKDETAALQIHGGAWLR
jgi:hypothetical protein